MRKVVSWLFMSLDGVVESPDQWLAQFDDDMGAAMSATLDTQDAVLLGRVTYDAWAPYWPTATDEPFASFINGTPKYVVSKTLVDPSWANTSVLAGSLDEAVTALKAQPGRDIGIHGSPSVVRALFEAGLLDELRLMIAPVVVGRGAKLFGALGAPKHMRLVHAGATRSGTMLATYRVTQDT
jgi:dihydrofolate reductase